MAIARKSYISSLVISAVYARDNCTCQTCGLRDPSQGFLSMGHVHAETNGGDTSEDNLIAQCLVCQQKQDKISLAKRPVWAGKVYEVPQQILAAQRNFARCLRNNLL